MAQRRAAATAKGGAAEEGFPTQTMDAWIAPAGSDGARLRVDGSQPATAASVRPNAVAQRGGGIRGVDEPATGKLRPADTSGSAATSPNASVAARSANREDGETFDDCREGPPVKAAGPARRSMPACFPMRMENATDQSYS
ncbi:hypothetical protein Bpla01_38830 [Burkholderia plantarii]|nr:hypothetical protein Bpla01_38830 [Burkholderia plantarii]